MDEQTEQQNIFVAKVQEGLARIEYLDRDDANIAINMIKNFVKVQERRKFACSGFCLNCDTGIQYGELSKSHMKYGDTWLLSLRSRWKTPITVQNLGRKGLRINGFSEKTVMPYLCQNCQKEIQSALIKQEEIDEETLREKVQHINEINGDIISGKVKTSPFKRFQVLSSACSQATHESLKSLPYLEFLNTNYWLIVRNYVLFKSGYKCSLCNGKSMLNVHHKDYTHHGEEHKYLEDLIVLCTNCHEKFHDIHG